MKKSALEKIVMKHIFLTGLLGMTALLSAQELLFTPGNTMGVNVNARENNRWKSPWMDVTEKIKPTELFETAGDFFQTQYGKPFIFQSDLIREFQLKASGKYLVKDGALQFHTGKTGWGVLFGSEPGDEKTPAIRVGAGWGKESSNSYRLEMEVEQDVPETEWLISKAHGDWKAWQNLKSFRIKGKGPQKFTIKMGWIGYPPLQMICGLKFECKTPGALVKIRFMRLVPYSGNAFWRREFQLDFKPVAAKLSWIHKTGNHEIFVNGKKIAEGMSHRRHGVETFDLTSILKQGKNTIAVRDQFYGGLTQNSDLALEGVAIGKNGELFRILGGKEWRWSFTAPKGWEQPDFRADGWKVPRLISPGVTRQPNGNVISAGFDPEHMGFLDVRVEGVKYPVFDYNGNIGYRVRIPSGIAEPEVKLEIRDADTGKSMEKLTASETGVRGDFREFKVEPKLRRTGAYRMFWTLNSNGKEMDSCRDEMIIAGPVPQDVFPLAEFEQELQKRLQLVQKIDCTVPNPPADTFLDHSGMYAKAELNIGKVVSKNGMKYRETGSGLFDYFCYKLNIPKLGEPMIAEVIFPDDADRYIYSCVAETFPVPFENNGYPLGERAWPNASGTVSTGDFYPLGNGKKALRYVFFPASYNSTIMIQNGRAGIPAAACEINIYAVKGGLPALKLPETDRIYANHNERIVFNNWGAYGDPVAQGLNHHLNNYDGAWINAYRAIVRKIQWLRFQGHNASVEGAYMYSEGPFSSRHSTSILNNDKFDYYYAILKLYKHNGIKQLVGFEYMRSISLGPEGRYDVTDQQIREGKARGVYTVDRHGKQVVGYLGMGLNFMNPVVWESVTDLLKELYNRYDGVGDVVGLFNINGSWWLPGFTTYSGIVAAEVGYDDDSVEAFEKDTGIKLGIPATGVDRFPKRYELLTGKYNKQWFEWRGKKLREKLAEMQKIVSSGKQKWQLFAVPSKRFPPQNPFNTNRIKPEVRNAYVPNLQKEAGFPQELYGKDKNNGIVLVASMNTAKRLENNAELYYYGQYTNKGTRELYRKNDAVYLTCDGLNENIGTTASAAKRWWFRKNGVTVYDCKPVGDFAYADMIHVVSDFIPKYMFHTWIDVNVPTAHGDQARRFLKAFYSVPRGELKKLDAVKGINAKTSGNYLVLVNDTPYPLTGSLEYPGKFTDLVYDLSCAERAELTVRPYTLLVYKAEGGAERFKGSFRFAPATESEIVLMGKNILKERSLLRRIPKANVERIRARLAANDVYGLKKEMDDFEVLYYAKRFFDSREQMHNQELLLKELEKTGTVRINCGASEALTDRNGNLWLPDQTYTGFNAYGNEYASYADRGSIQVKNTAFPEIFRSEAWGAQIFYQIPLPKGRYTVKVHFAETYPPNRENGRKFDLDIGGNIKKNLNPVVLGGGFLSAASAVWTGIDVRRGPLVIRASGNPALNGIEIIKEKTK